MAKETNPVSAKDAEKDAKGRKADAERAGGEPNREHALKKLADLQKEYDDVYAKMQVEVDPLRKAAALNRKGEITRDMDKIKRAHDIQPTDLKAAHAAAESALGSGVPTPEEKEATSPAATAGPSPVARENVADAVDAIGRMTSKDKLQDIVDHDKRSSVVAAAQERLTALG